MTPSHLALGNQALKAKDFERALQHYRAAQAAQPALAHLLKANIELVERRLQASAAKGEAQAPAASTTIDVVVPVFNALEDVKRCLASLEQHTDGLRVRVIVVNDGSDADTTQWLRAQCQGKTLFTLIEHPENQGYTRAVNTGLRASTAEFVITQNSDTIVTPGWLQGMVLCMASDPKIGVVGPLSNAASWQNVPQLRDASGNFTVNDLPQGMSPDAMAALVARVSQRRYPRLPFVNGFCFMIRRAVIDEIGYMDEENFPVGYGEENDFCIRAIDAGFELAIADNVFVFHAKSKSFGHEKRKVLSEAGNSALIKKHGREKFKARVDETANRSSSLNELRKNIAYSLQTTLTEYAQPSEANLTSSVFKHLTPNGEIWIYIPLPFLNVQGNEKVNPSTLLSELRLDELRYARARIVLYIKEAHNAPPIWIEEPFAQKVENYTVVSILPGEPREITLTSSSVGPILIMEPEAFVDFLTSGAQCALSHIATTAFYKSNSLDKKAAEIYARFPVDFPSFEWDALSRSAASELIIRAEESNDLDLKRAYISASHSIQLNNNHPNTAHLRNCRGEIQSLQHAGVIAFYLPQFHPTPFNDANWGKGFTEWTNATKATPRFPGHVQPKLPSDLGFYDLRLPESMQAQAEIAQSYGIFGFCIYYYRFGKRRELDVPLNVLRKNPNINMPYSICWANESWTRAWDGKTSEVLVEQTYDDATISGLINDFIDMQSDDRYIRINGRGVLTIYQVNKLPDPKKIVDRIRREIQHRLGIQPIIAGVHNPEMTLALSDLLDFTIQFPPHRIPRRGARITINRNDMHVYDESRHDYFESYDEVANTAQTCVEDMPNLAPGVCPDWDNSARRQKNATILVGSSPVRFHHWAKAAQKVAKSKFARGLLPAPIFFINAWNEWAEGAFMEPSQAHGHAYLKALRDALADQKG